MENPPCPTNRPNLSSTRERIFEFCSFNKHVAKSDPEMKWKEENSMKESTESERKQKGEQKNAKVRKSNLSYIMRNGDEVCRLCSN